MFWKTELCRNAWHWDIDSFPSIYITRCFLLSFSQDYVTHLSKQEHEEVYWQEKLTFPLVITGCHIDGQVWKHHQSVINKQEPAFSLPHGNSVDYCITLTWLLFDLIGHYGLSFKSWLLLMDAISACWKYSSAKQLIFLYWTFWEFMHSHRKGMLWNGNARREARKIQSWTQCTQRNLWTQLPA